MTVKDVEKSVLDIAAIADDDEVAHSKEDELRESVLQAIADGTPKAKDLARAVLKTSELQFARWCA